MVFKFWPIREWVNLRVYRLFKVARCHTYLLIKARGAIFYFRRTGLYLYRYRPRYVKCTFSARSNLCLSVGIKLTWLLLFSVKKVCFIQSTVKDTGRIVCYFKRAVSIYQTLLRFIRFGKIKTCQAENSSLPQNLFVQVLIMGNYDLIIYIVLPTLYQFENTGQYTITKIAIVVYQ